MTRKEARQRVAEYMKANPGLTYKQVSEILSCGLSTVGAIAKEFGIRRQRKALSEADLAKMEGSNG